MKHNVTLESDPFPQAEVPPGLFEWMSLYQPLHPVQSFGGGFIVYDWKATSSNLLWVMTYEKNEDYLNPLPNLHGNERESSVGRGRAPKKKQTTNISI